MSATRSSSRTTARRPSIAAWPSSGAPRGDRRRQLELARCATSRSRHGAEYVDAGANLGFAAGVERRAAASPRGQPGDVLLLNPDAGSRRTASTAWRSSCTRPSTRVGASHRGLSTATDASSASPGRSRRRSRCGWGPRPRAVRARADFVIGAVLLLRWEALQQVGELDERFFLYAEETDWQRRAAELGWTCSRSARTPSQRTTAQARATTRAAAKCSSMPPRRPTYGSGTAVAAGGPTEPLRAPARPREPWRSAAIAGPRPHAALASTRAARGAAAGLARG